MKKFCLSALAAVFTAAIFAGPVLAAEPASDPRAVIAKKFPETKIDDIKLSPIPGIYQVPVGADVAYVSSDGRYIIAGDLYEVDTRVNITEQGRSAARVKLLSKLDERDMIVFTPQVVKHTITVFTDVECGYCRKLHSQIADYNAKGISVQYVAFPRAGLGSDDFREMVAVWCAADPRKALTDAKNDRPVAYRNCKNPVTMEYNLGQRMGLTGTPMVLTSDGVQLGGYLPPDAMRAQLDKLAAGARTTPSTATGAP
jgi:thiol:disulfide interchange protein DsbC